MPRTKSEAVIGTPVSFCYLRPAGSVECAVKRCHKCGWNPEIEAQRIARLKLEAKAEPPKKKKVGLLGRGSY